MSIAKNLQGAWVISDIVNGFYVSRAYFYYTKKEAIRLFKQETKKKA